MTNEPRYSVIRYHKNDGARKVMQTGLTLAEAQEHCNDPESSSRTATTSEAEHYTDHHGPWFDGYVEE